MTLSDFFTRTFVDGDVYDPRPRIVCNDGFSMSVQGGYAKYSKPRWHGIAFSHYEIGYPSKREALIMPYVEDKTCPTRTVYAQVPHEVVEAVIAKHGGIDEKTSLNGGV